MIVSHACVVNAYMHADIDLSAPVGTHHKESNGTRHKVLSHYLNLSIICTIRFTSTLALHRAISLKQVSHISGDQQGFLYCCYLVVNVKNNTAIPTPPHACSTACPTPP